jgi:hypothetical protein
VSRATDCEDWEREICEYEVEILESTEYLEGDEDLGVGGDVLMMGKRLKGKEWGIGCARDIFIECSYHALWLVITLADTALRLRTANSGISYLAMISRKITLCSC